MKNPVRNRALCVLLSLVFLLGVVSLACTEVKIEEPALLPQGFELAQVPNLPLDGYVYLNQGEPSQLEFQKPLGTLGLGVNSVSVWLSPSGDSEATAVMLSLASPSVAELAYYAIDGENLWKRRQGDKLFLVYGSGDAASALQSAILSDDFVDLQSKDPDLWNRMMRLPTSPSGKPIVAGFMKLSSNTVGFLEGVSGADLGEVAWLISILRRITAKPAVFAFYSTKTIDPMKITSLADLDKAELAAFLIARTSVPGFVLKPALDLIGGSAGLKKIDIDGDEAFVTSLGSLALVLKNLGSYVYLTVAPSQSQAEKLLKDALTKMK